MKNRMSYVLPRNASDAPAGIDSMNGLDTLLDGLDPNSGDPAAGAGDNQDPGKTDDQDPGADPGTDPDPTKDGQQQDPPAVDPKAHQAFAQLRAENTAVKNAMRAFAKANNLQFKDDADLMEQIQALDLKKRAEAQNLPPEVLERLEKLEQQNRMYSDDQLRTQALVGFQKVKDEFKLTPQELQTFGDSLLESGINPFEHPVDIIKEYRHMNFDRIVEQRVNAAVEEALKRKGAANDNSTTPPSKKGGGSHTGRDIATVGDLNALLDQLK